MNSLQKPKKIFVNGCTIEDLVALYGAEQIVHIYFNTL